MQRPALRPLWPYLLLLGLEAAALAVLALAPGGPPHLATPFSIVIAGLVLLAGLLPALLRPSTETALAGCLAAVLAAVLVTPAGSADLPAGIGSLPAYQVVPPYLLLRLANGAAIGPLVFHLTARFPRRASLPRWALPAVYLVSLGLLLGLLFLPPSWLRLLAVCGMALWELGLLGAAAGLLLRASRQSPGVDPRPAQQARLLFFALLLAGLPALLRPAGYFLRIELIPYNLFLAFQLLVPLGVAYAVLRHDLFGIDSAVRRALAYTVVSVALLAFYLGVTVGLTALLARAMPEFRGLAALLALFVAAAAFEPLRRRVQRLVDRLLYPDRLNFQRALAAAMEALSGVVTRSQVMGLLTETLPPQLGAAWASLSLAPEPDLPGHPESAPVWNASLVVSGRSLGRYWLGPRRAGPDYDAEERAQLRSLAGQAALALAYADTIEALSQLNRDLEARVAERTGQLLQQQRALAAYDERQRLARDLHDSITQSLFSINLSARALRGLVRRDPLAAVDGLQELETAAQQALGEMRTLLAQLRAPAPVSPASPVDLAPLLREHCAALRRGQPVDAQPDDGLPVAPWLEVVLDLPAEIWLPEPLAQQALQMVREGLHNALKHSGGRRADCRVVCEGDDLLISISDDGQGFDPQAPANSGYGLAGMRERLAALGGSLEIVSAPWQGATLRLRIPTHSLQKADG